jgi:Asp-tRNA(Asn)/Glu-tRNA(Gln) amidotransferase A subunit family amidase
MSARNDSLADLARLSLREAAAGIRDRAFSATALASGYLVRIRAHEARIHAWTWLDEDRVLAAARQADETLRRGQACGALHGIPIGIKDIIHTRGIPTRMGSPIFADFVPARSASCIERLERAGGYVQGKTVTTEFANQRPGPTTNPWNGDFTPGGSSSGSAAAVAAGFTAAGIGSQTLGSTIRPAAYCGVVGFKPSFGVISRAGVNPLSATLDHVGVLTRSVDDAGLLVACLAGRDSLDPDTLDDERVPSGLDALQELATPPRLAAMRSPAWDRADAAQRALFDANCRALGAAGARVETVELPADFSEVDEAARSIQVAEIAHNFRSFDANARERMSASFRALVELGEKCSALDYLAALATRAALRKSLDDLLGAYDAIVTPPASGEAPRTLAATGDPAFCTLWTLCGLPSVTIPTGIGPQGMPMGLQIVGGYLEDRRTLQVARWCAGLLPMPRRLAL